MIIILGTYVNVGENVFYDRDNMNDIGKIAHVLKHSYGTCVVGSFDKNLQEGYIWTGHRYVLLFIICKLIFLHFVYNGKGFYGKYIIR